MSLQTSSVFPSQQFSTTIAPTTKVTIGVLLALSGGLLNGLNYFCNKKAHNRALRNRRQGAEPGFFRSCREPLWYASVVFMICAEILNGVAYSQAPATVVVPMGATSMIATAVLSLVFREERLNRDGIMGIFLCILGVTLVVTNVSHTKPVLRITEVENLAFEKAFLAYLLAVGSLNSILIPISVAYLLWRRRTANTRTESSYWKPLIPITSTASIGSLTLCAFNGILVAVTEAFDRQDLSPVAYWFTDLLGVAFIIFAIIQIIFFNISLSLFNMNVVCPLLYAEFNCFSIVATSILYEYSWNDLTWKEYIGVGAGFLVTLIGTLMLPGGSNSNPARDSPAATDPPPDRPAGTDPPQDSPTETDPPPDSSVAATETSQLLERRAAAEGHGSTHRIYGSAETSNQCVRALQSLFE